MLKYGLVSGAALLLPRPAAAQTDSPPTVPFSAPLRIPPVLRPTSRDETTDYYEILMQPAQVSMIPGLSTAMMTYGGEFPGPTILARRGRNCVVRQRNGLTTDTTIHLHGGHVPASSDGHPMDLIAPGGFKDYFYPNSQLPATLWYHDHAMDATAANVYRGLAGCYIISDDLEDELPLPKGRFEVPLVIQDRSFNTDGSLLYNPNMLNGFLGDRILVNGVIQPFFFVERRKYRFRILNGSNARRYQLALSSGHQFIQIGSDLGLLSVPVARTSLTVAPAERLDVVIDFAQVSAGTDVVLNNLLGSGTTAQVMQFRVMPKRYGKWEKDPASIPAVLRPVEIIPASSASVTRNFTLTMVMGPGGPRFLINGLGFDPERIDANPQLGATEIWVFNNQTSVDHPMHIHDIGWQILDINGSPPQPWDQGWKDTFNVAPGQTVRVIGKFTDFTGDYVFHCHNLEHEDMGMMAQLRVS